jgi:hypothetical protein
VEGALGISCRADSFLKVSCLVCAGAVGVGLGWASLFPKLDMKESTRFLVPILTVKMSKCNECGVSLMTGNLRSGDPVALLQSINIRN